MSQSILTITIKDLQALKEQQTLTLHHPFIENLTIKISREQRVEQILGQQVRMTGQTFTLWDNQSSLGGEGFHKGTWTEEDLISYLMDLWCCQTLFAYQYQRNLAEKGLAVGSRIELSDGKQGIIAEAEPEAGHVTARYYPLKKDGTPSKKARYLYRGTEFIIRS